MTFKLKIVSPQTFEFDLENLPTKDWPPEAITLAHRVLNNPHRLKSVFSDLFPRSKLLEFMKRLQESDEEMNLFEPL